MLVEGQQQVGCPVHIRPSSASSVTRPEIDLLAHRERYVWKQTLVIVVGAVPTLWTVGFRNPGLFRGGGIMTKPANAVTSSFGPDANFV
jgi:hypothetical protein